MKFVKVTIRRGGAGEPMMKYPAPYNAQEVDRMGIGPTQVNLADISYSGDMSRGRPTAFCIIMLPDALAASYAESNDMEIITDVQADTLMEANRIANRVPEEMVSDPVRLQAIQTKTGAGVSLTSEDLKALDISDRTPGIVRSRKTAAEIRADLGV